MLRDPQSKTAKISRLSQVNLSNNVPHLVSRLVRVVNACNFPIFRSCKYSPPDSFPTDLYRMANSHQSWARFPEGKPTERFDRLKCDG